MFFSLGGSPFDPFFLNSSIWRLYSFFSSSFKRYKICKANLAADLPEPKPAIMREYILA